MVYFTFCQLVLQVFAAMIFIPEMNVGTKAQQNKTKAKVLLFMAGTMFQGCWFLSELMQEIN